MTRTTIGAMLASSPARGIAADLDLLGEAVEAAGACAAACSACADACLGEPTTAELVRCIRSDLVCAELCAATASLLARPGAHDADVLRPLLEACIAACIACAEECERHAGMHEHCRLCAEACRRCETACRDLIAALD